MKVSVGLVVFAANPQNLMNSYVLLQKSQNSKQEIPTIPLPSNKDSISTVSDLFKNILGFSTNWTVPPRQVGVFDDPNRNPQEREILIIYCSFLPEKTNIEPNDFDWFRIDSISPENLCLDGYNIIRYCVTRRGE